MEEMWEEVYHGPFSCGPNILATLKAASIQCYDMRDKVWIYIPPADSVIMVPRSQASQANEVLAEYKLKRPEAFPEGTV